MEPRTVPEFLRAAVHVIDTGGWTQGTYFDDDGQRCVIGAMMNVSRWAGNPLFWRSVTALATCLNVPTEFDEYIDDAQSFVIRWNDRPGRTVEQVKEALLSCADRNDNTDQLTTKETT